MAANHWHLQRKKRTKGVVLRGDLGSSEKPDCGEPRLPSVMGKLPLPSITSGSTAGGCSPLRTGNRFRYRRELHRDVCPAVC